MPLYTDAEYNALLCVAGVESKKEINWEAEPIRHYCEEKYGFEERDCYSSVRGLDLDEKRKNVLIKRRARFRHKARNYTVGIGEKGEKVLLKNGLPILRTKEYPRVLEQYHDHNIHVGAKKLRRVLTAKFADIDYKTVDDYCYRCMHCNTTKPSHRKVMHKKPRRTYNTFQRIGIDFAEYSDPRNDGRDKYNILIIVDYFSRYAWIRTLPQRYVTDGDYNSWATGEMVATVLVEIFLSLSQVPMEIQSDNGSQFTSACVKHLMEKLKVQCVCAAPEKAPTGGRFEKFRDTIRNRISAILHENSDIAVSFAAALACFKYNQSPHSALYYRGQQLCPIDVWRPQLITRLSDNREILLNDQTDVVVESVDTDPPEFNAKHYEEHLKAINDRLTTATQSVMVAEQKVAKGKTIGKVKAPKTATSKGEMKKQTPVMVASVSDANVLLDICTALTNIQEVGEQGCTS